MTKIASLLMWLLFLFGLWSVIIFIVRLLLKANNAGGIITGFYGTCTCVANTPII